MAGSDWKWLEWLEMTRNGWIWLRMAGMAVNGFKVNFKIKLDGLITF